MNKNAGFDTEKNLGEENIKSCYHAGLSYNSIAFKYCKKFQCKQHFLSCLLHFHFHQE